MNLRRLLLSGFMICFIAQALSSGMAWAKSPILKNWLGQAVKGYDVVAYFTLGRPVKGEKAFQYKWQGATWRFSRAEHLAAFKAEPEKFVPQYGGY